MNRLEILSAYLPQGLKMGYFERPRAILNLHLLNSDGSFDILMENDMGFTHEGQNMILPILHPLDLTQKIWYNGEEIVPLIELAEIAFQGNDAENDWRVTRDVVVSSAGLTFGYNGKRDFYVSDADYHIWYSEYDLIQKLISWRINIFTEQELPSTEWINASELEINPYK